MDNLVIGNFIMNKEDQNPIVEDENWKEELIDEELK